ncbi:hypothetical protein ACRCUN_06185 [Mycobacterium sp. LTG2003]
MSMKCWPADDRRGVADAVMEDPPAPEEPVTVAAWPDDKLHFDKLHFDDPSGAYWVIGSRRGIFGWGRGQVTADIRAIAPTKSAAAALAQVMAARLDVLKVSESDSSRVAELLRRHFPRNEPLDVADPDLSGRILKALDASTTDFRTVVSLADELGVTREAVQQELNQLGESRVRRPLGQEKRYPDWYRLTKKGPTRQERLGRLKAILGFSAMDDDF